MTGSISIDGYSFSGEVQFPMQANVHTNNPPGGDLTLVSDFGLAPLILDISGTVTSFSDFQNIRKAFTATGEHALVLDTGWKYKIYRYRFFPVRNAGEKSGPHNSGTVHRFQASCICAEPYQFSSVDSWRSRDLTTNNETWTAEDQGSGTILQNWSFENWNSGTSVAPDFWGLSGTGATIARVADPKHGTYAVELTYGSSNANLYNENNSDSSFVAKYIGKTLALGAWVKCSTASRARIILYDGTYTNSSYHSGSGSWEWLSATRTISSTATVIKIYLSVQGAGSAIFDCAVLMEVSSIEDNTFSRNLLTSGEIDAYPDIQITGGAIAATWNRRALVNADTDATVYTDTTAAYVLKKTFTYTAETGRKWTVDTVGCSLRATIGETSTGKITYQATSLMGGVETTILEETTAVSASNVPFSATPSVTAAENETLTIRYYVKTSTFSITAYMTDLVSTVTALRKDVCKNPQVYNSADTTVKMDIGNEIEKDMSIRVNTDGTGTVTYSDTFITDKYLNACWIKSGVTYDDANNDLDIAAAGYLVYYFDTKYPITGIPTVTSQFDITAATPTIQISEDGTTYYDIDTAIVDNVSTEYELDNAANLSLKGKTAFYLRFDCAGAAAGTLKTLKLECDIVTIDAEHPKITVGTTASTFKCDQHANSGLYCTVDLIYADRRIPG